MYLQRWHGWCRMKLLPSRRKFCVHHSTMHVPCHFMQSRIRKVHACLAVTRHLHFWQNDRDLFTCYCGNTGGGGTDTEIRVSTENWPWRRFSRRSCRRFEPATFQSRVRRSNHWASRPSLPLTPPPPPPFPPRTHTVQGGQKRKEEQCKW